MVSNKKVFDEEDYKRNDSIAKIVASRFCMKDGNFELHTPVLKQAERYKSRDFDIYSKKEKKYVLVEAERKRCWICLDSWQINYDTMDVPCRKEESKAKYYGL